MIYTFIDIADALIKARPAAIYTKIMINNDKI